ncbi:MAG: hypothetical protein K2W33_18285 [Burkholderiales bacterium]|nr:hypothetical protein [Burkholderiales bacterium]
MSNLAKERIVDPVLTNLAVGYSNAQMVAHHLFPFVNVDKEAGLLPKFGKDAFLVYDTERAIRAESNQGDLDKPDADSFTLVEHDLQFAVDDREVAESVFNKRRRAMLRASEGIRLKHEVLVAGIVQNPANYPAGNKVALSGSTSFTHASSDPEGVIEDAKAAVSAGIVKDPNTMVIGYDMWRTLKRHPKLKAILSDSRSRLVQMADLREIFEIENIVVGRAMSKNTRAANTSRLWGRNIMLAYVPPAISGQPSAGGVMDPGDMQDIGEPSFGYTFRKRGMPVVDVRRAPNNKMDLVRSTDLFRPYLLGADAGYLIQDAG